MRHSKRWVIRRTLMCRDHEVVRFSYDLSLGRVVGKPQLIDGTYLPIGCLEANGALSTRRLGTWLRNRAVPATRPGLAPVLQRLALETPEELLAAGLGLSLSDQYWLKPDDATCAWADVNYFDEPFSPTLGEALAPHDPDTGSSALARLDQDGIIAASSPDSALNGNLPKRWEIADGTRTLIKSGKAANLYQEPFNEFIATHLCARIMDADDFVPYELVRNGYPAYVSACPCMVDDHTEFVPAADIILSMQVPNDQSRFEALTERCEANGIAEARRALEQMLVVDHIMANIDRHWGNFGILIDAETRTWLRMAPIFDTGEALWCDRALANDFSPYHMRHPMPFLRDIGSQLRHYARDLSWLDATSLTGFADEAIEALASCRACAEIPGRLDGIHAAIERNIQAVRDIQAAL